MLFVILFKDKAHQSELRSRLLPEHIAWLEQHKDKIPVGGSLRKTPEDLPQGGMWLAEAESKQEIESLLKTDPFFVQGLRESYEILHWSKANPARKVWI